ncbi:TetR/AcrR family transcriptional regulator [uncultured Microbacterium sp.]|uniref:TetR/AcrR family transcriptional regulator n=1 Tax=uncultured Microbacterium sp. TaxID=191216 RepID=UPI0025D8AFD6|nr:TetR/AcrR family transcriptional regulator [uncultured Microbacterium sp.]
MTDARGAGRPRVSSRETIAEAACELFLEQGFVRTQVAEIAQRAGVSRSSFFNYFASKSDVLWSGLDERLVAAETRLVDADGRSGVESALRPIADEFAPDALALAITNAQAMGLGDELDRERSLRLGRLQRAIAPRLAVEGTAMGLDAVRARLEAEAAAGAYAAAVLAAVWLWADRAAASESLANVLEAALAAARS